MGYTYLCREERTVRKKILDHQVSDTGLSALFLVEEGILFKHYLVFVGYSAQKIDHIYLTTRDKKTARHIYDSLAKDLM